MPVTEMVLLTSTSAVARGQLGSGPCDAGAPGLAEVVGPAVGAVVGLAGADGPALGVAVTGGAGGADGDGLPGPAVGVCVTGAVGPAVGEDVGAGAPPPPTGVPSNG
nr:hypothetical protein [Parafrankia soli]